MDLLRAVSVAEPLHYSKNTAVIAAADTVHQLLPVKLRIIGPLRMVKLHFKRTYCLEETLFKGTADSHNFARSLHLRAKLAVRTGEFVKGKTREFRHDIIQSRLKTGIRCPCHRVDDLIQMQPYSKLRTDLGNRVPCCLACQRRRPRYTRIDFDHII